MKENWFRERYFMTERKAIEKGMRSIKQKKWIGWDKNPGLR